MQSLSDPLSQNRLVLWMKTTSDLLSVGRTFSFTLAALVLSLAIAILFIKLMRTDSIIVHPIAVPESLSKRGYTPDVVAARVAAEMRRINRETTTLMARRGVLENEDQLDIKIPGQFVSFQTLVHYLKEIVGTEDVSTNADVTEDNQNFLVQVRVLTGPHRDDLEMTNSPKAESIEALILQIAKAIMKRTQPYILASYEMDLVELRFPNPSEADYREALSLLNSILTGPHREEYKWALVGHASISTQLKKYREAIDAAQEATTIDPRFAVAYASWGTALNYLNRYEEAIEKFKLAIRYDRHFSVAYNNWGVSLINLKQYPEAIDKCKRAIDIDPTSTNAYTNWGFALNNLKQYPEAIERCKKAIHFDSTYSAAYNNWGCALDDLKRYPEAIEKYTIAIHFDSTYSEAYSNWGVSLNNLKLYPEAIEKCKKAIHFDSTYSAAYNNWGCALENLKEYQEAILKYKKATELDTTNGLAFRNLGRVLELTGNELEAKELYDLAAKHGG